MGQASWGWVPGGGCGMQRLPKWASTVAGRRAASSQEAPGRHPHRQAPQVVRPRPRLVGPRAPPLGRVAADSRNASSNSRSNSRSAAVGIGRGVR